jgi:hypothetical protein
VDSAESAVSLQAPAGTRIPAPISLRRTRLVELSGTVVDATTRDPIPGIEVELCPRDDPYSDTTFERRPLGERGSFRFELIQPARYRLLLFRGGGEQLPYVVPLDVGPKGTLEEVIMMPANARIETRIKLPDDAAEPPESLVVVLDPRITGIPPREILFQRNGSKSIEGVPPGSYRIAVKWDGAGSRPKDWYVSGLWLGSEDATHSRALVVAGAIVPLAIEISGSGGRIAGRVVNSQPRMQMALFVTVSPADQPMMSQLVVVHPDSDGRF